MTTSISTAQIEQLRRNAKRLGRTLSIPHSEALDRIAVQHGFKNWSLLAKHSTSVPGPGTTPPHVPAPRPEPRDTRQRYYLHGDQSENDPTSYYCAQCDIFFDADHFASHGPHTGERFLERLERWKKRNGRSEMDWRRPDDAVNVLHESALAARAQYQALRPVFSDWLMAQRRRLRAGEHWDNVALMAVWFLSNRGLPKTPKSLLQLQNHYQRMGKRIELKSLEEVWDKFLAQYAER